MDYIYGQLNDYAMTVTTYKGGETDFAKVTIDEEDNIKVDPNLINEGTYLVEVDSEGYKWKPYDIKEVNNRITFLENYIYNQSEDAKISNLSFSLRIKDPNGIISTISENSEIVGGCYLIGYNYSFKGGMRPKVSINLKIGDAIQSSLVRNDVTQGSTISDAVDLITVLSPDGIPIVQDSTVTITVSDAREGDIEGVSCTTLIKQINLTLEPQIQLYYYTGIAYPTNEEVSLNDIINQVYGQGDYSIDINSFTYEYVGEYQDNVACLIVPISKNLISVKDINNEDITEIFTKSFEDEEIEGVEYNIYTYTPNRTLLSFTCTFSFD